LPQLQVTCVTLSGGEPLIREDFFRLAGATPGTNDAIRGPGSFTAATRAIHLLKQAGIRTSIATTLSGMNIHDYKDIFLPEPACGQF